MKVNARAQDPPKNDEERIDKNGTNDLLGFGNELYIKLIKAAPVLLPLLTKYGFKNRYPVFKLSFKGIEIQFGKNSILVYIVFLVEFAIKLVFIAIYFIVLAAIVLVILRGLQLPEYILEISKKY